MPTKPAKVRTIPVDDIHTLPTKVPTKRHVIDPSAKGSGMAVFNDVAFKDQFTQPIVKKQDKGRDTWANTALVLVERAKKAAQTYGKKDFNALYRLVLSAGIAFDKAFPQQQAPQGGNLVIQLFGSLGSDTTRAILEPPRPTILDITPTPVLEPALPEAGGSDTQAIPTKVEPQ